MHYLDHAATTPLTPAAAQAFTAASQVLGNPSSAHGAGRAARRVVEEAREQVAANLGAAPADVVFTSSGTEADNLAVIGLARAVLVRQPQRRRVLVSAVEHPAVREAAESLRGAGFDIGLLPVGRDGRVLVEAAARLIDETTALVSCLWANNETGAIQPVAELAGLAHAQGALMHSDAVQAVGCCPVTLSGDTNLDALTVTAHKLGGPVGIGALIVRSDTEVMPLTFGGGQERRLRSGTVPVALIAAFAQALADAVAQRPAETTRLGVLSARLMAGLAGLGAEITGPANDALRSPAIVDAIFPGCRGDDLLLLLDQAGIACSAGSACAAGVIRPSQVLLAMGYDETEASSALRFSLGWTTADDDITAALDALPQALALARQATAAAQLGGL